MPKTRKVKISPEFVNDLDCDDEDEEEDKAKAKGSWNPKPKKTRRTKKSSLKKMSKGKRRRAISKISVVESPSTKEKPKKRKERSFGKPYSVTGNWYIATGYLQDVEHLLNLFEECEGLRFTDFASCWQSLSFSKIYRGRQNFKELLEFSEEMALLTKRFLWPNYSHKKNIGALYTLYGITYKHPIRTFFKVRLTKDEYKLLKDLVEPYRSKSDNPDPAYIFRKMELEGAFYNSASGEEHCLEFYSYEREVIDLEYQQLIMAKKAKVDLLMSEKQMEEDDELLQHYHRVKCKILGDGTKPEASLAMVEPNTVKGMQRIIRDTTDRNQQILNTGLYETERSPVGANCIGLRRSAIRDKAIRVKPRCLYEQRDRNEKEKSGEDEALVNIEEDSDGVEEEDALMEKWNQKSPGEGQMKSRKRKPANSIGGDSKNILIDENVQTSMTTPLSQKSLSDGSPASKTPEGYLEKSRKGKPTKRVETDRSILFDKEVQAFMTAPPGQKPVADIKPSKPSSGSPLGELKKDVIKLALGRSSTVQTRRKAREEAEANLRKLPEKRLKKEPEEPHTPKKGISQASAISDPIAVEKPVSPNRRANRTPNALRKNLVSPRKGTGKLPASPDKAMDKTPVPSQSTIFPKEEGKQDKATEECVASAPRRKRGRPRKTDKAKPAVEEINNEEINNEEINNEEINNSILTDKSPDNSTDNSPEKSPGQFLERRKRKRERPRKYALFEASNEEEEIIQPVWPRRRKGFHLEEQIDCNGLSKEVEMTNIVRRLVHEKNPKVVELDPDSTTIILPHQQYQLQQSSLPLSLGSRTWPGSRLPTAEQNLTFSYARKNQSSSPSFADSGSTLVSLRLKVNINALVRKVTFQMTRKKWLEVKNDQRLLDAILEKLKPHLLLNLTGSKGDPSRCIIEDIVEVPGPSRGRPSSSDMLWGKKKGKLPKMPNITTSSGQHMLFSYKTSEEPSCQSSPLPCHLRVVKLPDGKVVLVKPLGPESASDIESYESGADKPKKMKAPFMIIPLPPNYNVGGMGGIESKTEMIEASRDLEKDAVCNGPTRKTHNRGLKAGTISHLQKEVATNSFGENMNAAEIVNVGDEDIGLSTLENDSHHPIEVEEETTCISENNDEPLSSPVQETDVWSVDDDDSVLDDDGCGPGEEEDDEESHGNARKSGETMPAVHRVSCLESNKDTTPDTLGSSVNTVSNLQGSEVTPPRSKKETMQQFSQPTTAVTSMPPQTSTPQKGEPYSIFVSTGIHVPIGNRTSVEENGEHEGMESTGVQAQYVLSTEEDRTREIWQEAEFITSDPCTPRKGWEQNAIIPVSARDVPSIYPVQGPDISPQYAKVLEAIPVQVDLSRNPLKFEDQVSITINEDQHLSASVKEDRVGPISRVGTSGRIADALELCQLSVDMAEATGAAPTGVDMSQYISALRVAQGRKEITRETSSTSTAPPVVLYTPVLLQNLVKTEIYDEPEGGLGRKTVEEDPEQVTENDSALPNPPEECKLLSSSLHAEKPAHPEVVKTRKATPKKLLQSSLPHNLPPAMPVTESKAGIHLTPASTDALNSPQNPVLPKRVSRTPVCSFLFSPKFKPLSKLSTCVGEATGKVQQRPRVKFFSKSYLFPRGRKSV